MTLRASLLAIAASITLGGCVSLFPDPPPPPAIYPLEAGDVAPLDAPRLDLVATVAMPSGPRMLLDDGIVWRENGVLAYMGGASWPGQAPELLQAMLAQTITQQGVLAAGVRQGEGARGDVEVRWDLIAFEVVEDGATLEARFAAHVRIMQVGAPRMMLHSEIVDVREPLASRSGSAAANALARAARQGSARIAEMTAEAAFRLERGPQPNAASTSR